MTNQDQNKTHFELLLKGGQALLRSSNGKWHRESVDIGIQNGKIAAIGSIHPTQSEAIFQAKGLTILPGLLDTQVHFREPGLEHKEDLASGTLGALLGGITGIFEMPNTNPSTLTSVDLADKMTRAMGRAWTDYAFYLGASSSNVDKLKILENLPGCCGIKIFMGSSTGSLLVADHETLRRVLSEGRRRVAVHCEDEERLVQRKALVEKSPGDVHLHPLWRDEETALLATKRIISIAEAVNRPIHVLHVSTAEEMEFLRHHKDICTVECLPQHLTLTSPECYDRLGTLAQMNPPIRSKKHQEALWKAVLDGTVDVLGSDHAPHTLSEKSRPYPQSPSGMTGVQTILPIMLSHVHSGKISLERVVELMSFNPAKIWKLEGRGEIKVGAQAHLSIVDLNKTKTIERSWIASKSGWSPFEGMKITGWPSAVILQGLVAMRDEEVIGKPLGKPIQFQ